MGSMFHPELGVDFDRAFSSGYYADVCFAFFVRLFGHNHKVSELVTKNPSFSLGQHQEKSPPQSSSLNPPFLAEKPIAESVTTTRTIVVIPLR